MSNNLGDYQWFTTMAARMGGVQKALQNTAQQGYNQGLKDQRVQGAIVLAALVVVMKISDQVVSKRKEAKAIALLAQAELRAAEAEAKLAEITQNKDDSDGSTPHKPGLPSEDN